MRLLHSKPAARRGFTLIELLVVIAVIAVLVALTTAAVIQFLGAGPELADRTEINNIGASLKNFYAKYSSYPPSRIRLFANASQYKPLTNTTHKDTLTIIGKMFPNMNWTNIDWTGNNNPAAFPAKGILLEGDQCLVFFLGGLPGPGPSCQGFSTNTLNPTVAGGERIKFYNFQTSRLKALRNTANNPFLSYLNAYTDSPVAYAYFSPGSRGSNQYNSVAPTGTGKTDCSVLGLNPYASAWGSPPTFINPDTFQIISAGADGKFGAGTTSTTTVWAPNNTANVGVNGKDDNSNFSDRVLGAQ